MKKTIKLLTLTIFFITGCNDSTKKIPENNSTTQQNTTSTESNSTENNSTENNSTITGKVIEGEITGATVFLDLDKDNELDSNEPNSITKSDGSYMLTLTKENRENENYKNKTAPLIAFNGKDIRTQKAFDDYLMALRNESNLTYITPFSTLIAQTLFDELEEKINSNKFQKTSREELSNLEEKITLIKKNLAELFGIKESLLEKNPIDLAKAGDNNLLNSSLQLHKTAKEMKKAMKSQVKILNKSILKAYRALGKSLRKLKRDAIKDGESPLAVAIENSMQESEIFDTDLVQEVKKETKSIIKDINNFWQGQEGTLTDNALSSAIKDIDNQIDNQVNNPIDNQVDYQVNNPINNQVDYQIDYQVNNPINNQVNNPIKNQVDNNNSDNNNSIENNSTSNIISDNYSYIPKVLDDATAIRFLNKATFGANKESIEDLKSKGIVKWLDEQLNLPLNDNQYLIKMIEESKKMSPEENSHTVKEYLDDNDIMFNQNIGSFHSPAYRMSAWFDIALTSKDQLRQKVTYALSQIIVESDFEPIFIRRAEALATYFDILQRNAFGKYKDLLNEISLNSGMGVFLTFNGNKKKYQNEANVTVYPDENYAREIMQLFSIGLMKLNIDGTPILDNNGNSIPTYTQEDVNELARVFTGWDLKRNTRYGLVGIKRGDYTHPLEFTAEYHDGGEKKVLGKTIPAGLSGKEDIQKAIDIIMSDNSAAPFISKQLIMRLTKSNPSKNYIKRVAEVFKASGGDLKATTKAIFLDEELWENIKNKEVIKFKEPLIAYTSFLRAFNAKPFPSWYFCSFGGPSDDNASNCQVVKNSFLFGDTRDVLNQGPGLAPTVFNFYDNNFIPNSTEFKTDKLVAPEIQIQSDTVFIKLSNMIYSNLTHWEKNYILNASHHDYKNGGKNKRYNSIEEFVKDAPKRGYIPVYYVGAEKLLIDVSEELDVMEKVIDGDTDGDFKKLQDFRDSNYTDDEKAVDTLVEHLNQKLTARQLTTEQTDIIAKNLKQTHIFNKYSKNDPSIEGRIDETKYNKKRQLLNNVIFPAIREIVTSSAYMTE